MNATLVDGKVVFETNHFSTYAVILENKPVDPDPVDPNPVDPQPSDPEIAPEKSGLSAGAIAGIVIGSFFGLLLIACAVLFLLHKKGVIKIPFLK